MQHQEVLLQASTVMDTPPSLDLASARRLAMLEFREQMSARWIQDGASGSTSQQRSLPPRQPSRRGSGIASSGFPLHYDHPSLEREWKAHECPSSASSSLRMPMRSLDDTSEPPQPPARMPAAA